MKNRNREMFAIILRRPLSVEKIPVPNLNRTSPRGDVLNYLNIHFKNLEMAIQCLTYCLPALTLQISTVYHAFSRGLSRTT